MAKKILFILGVVFVAVGLLGFIPNPIVGGSDSALFQTNLLHDLVHLISGIIFIYVSKNSPEKSTMTMKVFGGVYLLIALLGFLLVPNGGDLLGLVRTNSADHLLHIFLGVVILGAAFYSEKK